MIEKSILILRYQSTGAGLLSLNQIEETREVKIIEAGSLGHQGFWILLQGVRANLQKILTNKDMGMDLIESSLIEDLHQDLLSGIYSLQSTEISKELLVVESKALVPFIEFCNGALNRGARLVEIKIDRGARKYHCAIFSGEGLDQLLSAGQSDLQIQHIPTVSGTLREYLS